MGVGGDSYFVMGQRGFASWAQMDIDILYCTILYYILYTIYYILYTIYYIPYYTILYYTILYYTIL